MFHLFRNRDVGRLLTMLVVIGLAGLVAAAFVSWAAVGIVALVTMLFIVVALVYVRRQYREVDTLSQYLAQVVQGIIAWILGTMPKGICLSSKTKYTRSR